MRVNATMMTNMISNDWTSGEAGSGGSAGGAAGGVADVVDGAAAGCGNQVTTIKVQTNIVLTNVVVRDKKTGEVVKGLKPSDFTILEDNKPQKIASFDYENVDQAAVLKEKGTTVSGKATVAQLLNQEDVTDPKELQDHRLIVMFFDLSSMQPEDIDRSVDAARDYINKKMQPADLVAMVSLSGGLTMDQDFTADKDLLLKAVGKYDGSDATGFASGNEGGDSDGTAG